MWAIKHKSGRVLFVTDSKVTADNRRKMGWIVEELKMTSREQFEVWFSDGINEGMKVSASGGYENLITQTAWLAWQASRADIELELPSKYYSDAYFGNGCCDDYANNILDKVYLEIKRAGLRVKK